MKKILGLASFAFALLVGNPHASMKQVLAAPAAGEIAAGRTEEPLATDRYVHGVITSVDPATMAITSAQRTVAGKIDPSRTTVTIGGKPARLTDLKISAHAKGELCLDDVWLAIDLHEVR